MSRTTRNRRVLDEDIELHHDDRRVRRLREFADRISSRYKASQMAMWLKEASAIRELPEDLCAIARAYSEMLEFQRDLDRQMSA